MAAIIARHAAALAHSPAYPLCGTGNDPNTIALPGIRIDLTTRRVWVGGKEVELSRKEFDIIVYFGRRPGAVVSKQDLYAQVWGYTDVPVASRTIDSHMSRIRCKFQKCAPGGRLIGSVWGVGWRLLPG